LFFRGDISFRYLKQFFLVYPVFMAAFIFDLEVKGQGPTKVITVRDTPPDGHAPTYHISLTSGKTKKLWSREASLRRSGSSGRRKNQTKTICIPSFEGET
jgi:hypothetical protein